MRAVDTNALVRLVARDDPRQLLHVERFIAAGAWVPHLVLVEFVWVLESVYGAARPTIARAVSMLLQHESLVVQDADVVELALRHFQSQASVQFSDCLILEVARKAGHLPLGTFDRGLAKSAGAVRIDSPPAAGRA